MSAAEIRGSDTAVDEAVVPVGRHATVVVAVEVGEKVAATTFDLAEAKSINGEWHAFQRFVKGSRTGFGSRSRLTAIVGSLDCVCCSPLLGLGVRFHEHSESRRGYTFGRRQDR